MQFTVNTTTGLERRIEVEIPEAQVAGEVERRLRDLSRTAKIRGFRPGKVPLPVIRQQFGSQVHGDAVSELIRQGYSDAVKQQNLRPAGSPNIEPLQIGPGADLRFAAVIEVMPDVVVNSVAEVEITRPVAEITAADVDAMLESMRRQRVTYAPVERAARQDDRVTVDFAGRTGGVAFEGGTGTDMAVVIGAGQVIPDFERALVGMGKGDSRTAPVKFPDDYGAAALAGKDAEFDLTVKSVEEPVLPPLDAAFAQSFGVGDGSLETMRAEVRRSMERQAVDAVRGSLRTQVFEALQRDNELQLPRALVEEQVQQLQVDLLQRMGRSDLSRLPPREPFLEPAQRRVKLGLLIGELVRRENLGVDRGRVMARLDEAAAGYPNPEEVRRAWLQNADVMRQIETSVMEDLAVEWVLAHARVKEQPVSFRELTGFGRQA
ncbi:MAG TPA: trigger factor [Steroidobacteraceae bacterium]|nr:trigger factor [Steroidobacteraceae bacterium]